MIIVALTLSNSTIRAQYYTYEKLSVKDGLVHSEVYDLEQGYDQSMWFATEGGLSRYDGNKFTNYSMSNGLKSNNIRALFEDSKHRLWIMYYRNSPSYIFHDSIYSRFEGMPDVQNWSFTESLDSTLFAYTHEYIYKLYDNSCELVFDKSDLHEDIRINFHQAIALNDSSIIISLFNKGTYFINLTTKQSTPTLTSGSSPLINAKFIRDEKTGSIYAFSSSIYKLSDGAWEEMPNSSISRIMNMSVSDNILYIATEYSGYFTYNLTDFSTTNFSTNKGLRSSVVYDIVSDVEGTLWIASYGEGVLKLSDKSFYSITEHNGLPNKLVQDIILWNDTIIIATDKGIIRVFNNQIIDSLLLNIQSKNLSLTKENALLVTTSAGLYEINSNLEIKFVAPHVGMQAYELKNGIPLLHDGGKIDLMDSEYSMQKIIPISGIKKIIPLKNGFFALSHHDLRYVDYNTYSIQKINSLDRYSNLRGMDTIDQEKILVTSESGIHLIEMKNDSFQTKSFLALDFPFLSNLTSLTLNKGNVWLTSQNQVMKLKLQKLIENTPINPTVYKYSSALLDGFPSDDGIVFGADSLMYIKSLSGVLVFNEALHNNDFISPYIDFKDILIEGKSIGAKHIEHYQKSSYLKIPESKSNLTFILVGNSLKLHQDVKFQYRIIGLLGNEEYSIPSSNSVINLSYLPEGEYTFEFKVVTSHCNPCEKSKRFNFIIISPFYKKIGFWMLVTSLLVLLTFLSIQYLAKQKIRKEKKFTERVINRFEEERKRLAREIHDGISQSLMLIIRKASTNKYMAITDLAKSTLNETRAISRGLHPPALKELGFTNSLNDIILYLKHSTDLNIYDEIDNIDKHLNENEALHILRIIQESFNNIIKHANASIVTIRVIQVDDSINISIQDNGTGYTSDNQSSNSLGLKSMKERANYISAHLTINSKKNKGSMVKIEIPLKRNK